MLERFLNPIVLASIIVSLGLVISSAFYFSQKSDLEICIDEYIGTQLRMNYYIGSGIDGDETYEYSDEQMEERRKNIPERERSSAYFYCMRMSKG